MSKSRPLVVMAGRATGTTTKSGCFFAAPFDRFCLFPQVVSAEPPPPTELSGESEDFAMEVDEEERETESHSSLRVTDAASRRQEASRAETARDIKPRSATGAAESARSATSSGSAPSSSSSSAPSKPGSRRTPCPYGKGCYR